MVARFCSKMPGSARNARPIAARLCVPWAVVCVKSGQSSAPSAVMVSAALRAAGVSARGIPRGEFEHALNCGQTAHALAGIGWQSGNWLLISRVNLLEPEEFPAFDDRGFGVFSPVRPHLGVNARICEDRMPYGSGSKWPSIHGLARQVTCHLLVMTRPWLRKGCRIPGKNTRFEDCPGTNRHLVNRAMSRGLQLAIILSAPFALVLAVFVLDRELHRSAGGRDEVIRFDLPTVDAPVDLPKVEGPADASRPLVVIDPGHGGFDPGAGQGAVKEKAVALLIALAIRDRLIEGGGIRVALTRDTDRFISLADRPDIARRLGADLFVSVHADSAENDSARGASVYVLSEKGTDEAARRFAATDRTSVKVNGVALSAIDRDVGAILLDLSQRNTQANSSEVGSLMLRELGEAAVGLHRDRVEAAALAVLKAPDIPSILLETGYINNPQDQQFLGSTAGQQTIAAATARAIRAFFARKSAV